MITFGKSNFPRSIVCVGLAAILPHAIKAADLPSSTPACWAWAPTPPMGWNSYDAFGSSVTEDEFLANARYVQQQLLPHGYQYVVVDYRWSDATAAKHDRNGNGGPLEMDQYGRLLPAPARFPSAAGGQGFKPLADKVHAMGLKFGIHVMRGIPRQAVTANTPIEGSPFKAADAVSNSTCGWCKDMWGVKGNTPAGQAYYDSIFRLYASWGVDFVKVDDLSQPYHKDEIEAVRRAIDKTGRQIVFSTSPGPTPVNQAAHISTHANMWRVSGDFWDSWGALNHSFDFGQQWTGVGGPGRWPDFDMIPFGRIGIRSVGTDRRTRFSHDEQMTLMSFWALRASPLMLGSSLTDNDPATLAMITNDDVLAVDQDPLGMPGTRLSQRNGCEIWVRGLHDGSKAVGLFNRGNADAQVVFHLADAGLTGSQNVRDLWQHKDSVCTSGGITAQVPRHGVVLLKLAKAP